MISSFRGRYRFLSNFYSAAVSYEGTSFATVEHAYQAAKTLDIYSRLAMKQYSAAGAKAWGGTVTLRPDWDAVKRDIMATLLREKFSRPELQRLLQSTAPQELIEGNTWGDIYWGICQGTGQNWLGRLLMQVRDGGEVVA